MYLDYWSVINKAEDLPTQAGKYWVTFKDKGVEKIGIMRYEPEHEWCKRHWLQNYLAWQPVITPEPFVAQVDLFTAELDVYEATI